MCSAATAAVSWPGLAHAVARSAARGTLVRFGGGCGGCGWGCACTSAAHAAGSITKTRTDTCQQRERAKRRRPPRTVASRSAPAAHRSAAERKPSARPPVGGAAVGSVANARARRGGRRTDRPWPSPRRPTYAPAWAASQCSVARSLQRVALAAACRAADCPWAIPWRRAMRVWSVRLGHSAEPTEPSTGGPPRFTARVSEAAARWLRRMAVLQA
jgi:hypothetical protein